MAVVPSALPAMGPLIGASFDRAFSIMAARWKVFAVFAGVAVVVGAFDVGAGGFVAICFTVYWYYASLANAVRLTNPHYAMTSEHVLRLIGLNIVYGIAVEIGLLLLIVPGIYIANKWSLSSLIAVKEDAGVTDAMRRSWHLTDPFFWPTLGFNILSGLAVAAVAFVGYFMMLFVFVSLFGFQHGQPPDLSALGGPAGMAATLGVLVYCFALAYTYQAKDIALLNWYNGLRSAIGEA